MAPVRVAIVGVGNCAASLVQGVHYYRNAAVEDRVPGLMHVKFGDYHVGDIRFVAACKPSALARTTPSNSPTFRCWRYRSSAVDGVRKAERHDQDLDRVRDNRRTDVSDC